MQVPGSRFQVIMATLNLEPVTLLIVTLGLKYHLHAVVFLLVEDIVAVRGFVEG